MWTDEKLITNLAQLNERNTLHFFWTWIIHDLTVEFDWFRSLIGHFLIFVYILSHQIIATKHDTKSFMTGYHPDHFKLVPNSFMRQPWARKGYAMTWWESSYLSFLYAINHMKPMHKPPYSCKPGRGKENSDDFAMEKTKYVVKRDTM